jgi:hypothetical protein
MAHILEFRSSAVRVESECEATLQGSAQIIIFPGVRIERHSEPPAEPQVEHLAKPRRRERGRAKRDRLVLPD